MAERPWIKFYTSDWRGSARLRSCSAGARALLLEMMCIMHTAEPYGHLAIAGVAITDDADIARHVTMSKSEVRRWRVELVQKGLIVQDANGVIHNPRMVRDEEIRRKRAEGGKKSIGHPHVHPPKDTHDGNPSTNGAKGTHKGSTQIPDARGQKRKGVHEHPKRNDSLTPVAAIVGVISPSRDS